MIKFTKSDVVDTDKYEQHLRYNGYIVFDKAKMRPTLAYEKSHAHSLAALAKDVMLHKSGGSCYNLDATPIYNYLLKYERCPERYFKKKGVQGISLDSGKVLGKLMGNNYANEFLGFYTGYKSIMAKSSKVDGIINRCNTAMGVNEFGAEVYRLPFSVNQQQNLRYNYKDSDIISAIPKEYCDCITVEEEYILAWGDFAQSDFRIAYSLLLRSPENDLIMNAYADKYEALARLVAKALHQEFDLIEFKKQRPLYKQLTLATMYGTRNSIIAEEQDFIKMFTQFLYTCPKYVEFEQRLRDRYAIGLTIPIESYFGHLESCPILYGESDTVNKALNTPIQTGTSEIIILTCNKILDMFYSLGYTEDDISIYYVRHDEPIFKIRKEILKDIWLLNQASTILVDNWVPLKLSFEFGYSYKVKDTAIEEYVQQVYDENAHRIIEYNTESLAEEDYYPVPPIFATTVNAASIPEIGQTVVGFYNAKLKSVDYQIVNSLDQAQIVQFVQSKVATAAEGVYEKGYRGILVKSDIFNVEGALVEDFAGGSYIKYCQIRNEELSAVTKLVRYTTDLYCKKKGIECPVVPVVGDDLEFVQSVSQLKLIA